MFAPCATFRTAGLIRLEIINDRAGRQPGSASCSPVLTRSRSAATSPAGAKMPTGERLRAVRCFGAAPESPAPRAANGKQYACRMRYYIIKPAAKRGKPPMIGDAEFDAPDAATPGRAGEALLEARGLTKRYGDHLALDRLDLAVGAGEILCLLGANGAGKTTTLNLFLGFAEPTAGAALVGGREVAADPAAARAQLGYVAEVVSLYPTLSGAENLDFWPNWPAGPWTGRRATPCSSGCAFRSSRSTAPPAPIRKACARSSVSPSR